MTSRVNTLSHVNYAKDSQTSDCWLYLITLKLSQRIDKPITENILPWFKHSISQMVFSMPTTKVVLISWKLEEMVMKYDHRGTYLLKHTDILTNPYKISFLNQNWGNAKERFLTLLCRLRYEHWWQPREKIVQMKRIGVVDSPPVNWIELELHESNAYASPLCESPGCFLHWGFVENWMVNHHFA